jgi:signal transduction histidine kinase
MPDERFAADVWRPSLERYGRVTHLTVVVYDGDGMIACGPFNSTPLFDTLAPFQHDPGLLRECVQRCLRIDTREPSVVVSRLGLAVVGAPLVVNDEVVGAAVAGYHLSGYPQTVALERLAHESKIPSHHLWDLARQEAPMSPTRLANHGELLHVLAETVLSEHERTRQHAEVSARLQAREAWLAGQKEAFQAAVNGAPLEACLGMLVRTAVEQADTDVRCAFHLADHPNAKLHHITGMLEADAACVDAFEIASDSLACGLAVYTGRPVITPDVAEDPRWKPWLWLAERHEFRACWSFPIETLSGKVVGTFAMYFKSPREATPRDYESAAVVTRAAAIIISRSEEAEERVRAEAALRSAHDSLEHRVRERTSQVHALFQRLVAAQEQERRRIARDIHDQVGQQITALRMNIEALRSKATGDTALLKQAERTERLAEELDQAIDSLAWELTPAALDHLGLPAALVHLISGWSERFGVKAEYETVGVDGLRFRPELESNLYRLAQEALHNVYKHAQASRVSVVLEKCDGRLVLVVEDDGVGFSVISHQGLEAGSMGLVSMRERANLVGGELTIDSSPGHGTTLIVRVPLGNNDNRSRETSTLAR